jgi:hypothetical protein
MAAGCGRVSQRSLAPWWCRCPARWWRRAGPPPSRSSDGGGAAVSASPSPTLKFSSSLVSGAAKGWLKTALFRWTSGRSDGPGESLAFCWRRRRLWVPSPPWGRRHGSTRASPHWAPGETFDLACRIRQRRHRSVVPFLEALSRLLMKSLNLAWLSPGWRPLRAWAFGAQCTSAALLGRHLSGGPIPLLACHLAHMGEWCVGCAIFEVSVFRSLLLRSWRGSGARCFASSPFVVGDVARGVLNVGCGGMCCLSCGVEFVSV